MGGSLIVSPTDGTARPVGGRVDVGETSTAFPPWADALKRGDVEDNGLGYGE